MEREKLIEFVKGLVETSDNLEENGAYYDEIINILKTPTDVDAGYKDKYERLHEEYRRKFLDMISETNNTPILEEGYDTPDTSEPDTTYDMRDLDFDGSTD